MTEPHNFRPAPHRFVTAAVCTQCDQPPSDPTHQYQPRPFEFDPQDADAEAAIAWRTDALPVLRELCAWFADAPQGELGYGSVLYHRLLPLIAGEGEGGAE